MSIEQCVCICKYCSTENKGFTICKLIWKIFRLNLTIFCMLIEPVQILVHAVECTVICIGQYLRETMLSILYSFI